MVCMICWSTKYRNLSIPSRAPMQHKCIGLFPFLSTISIKPYCAKLTKSSIEHLVIYAAKSSSARLTLLLVIDWLHRLSLANRANVVKWRLPIAWCNGVSPLISATLTLILDCFNNVATCSFIPKCAAMCKGASCLPFVKAFISILPNWRSSLQRLKSLFRIEICTGNNPFLLCFENRWLCRSLTSFALFAGWILLWHIKWTSVLPSADSFLILETLSNSSLTNVDLNIERQL